MLFRGVTSQPPIDRNADHLCQFFHKWIELLIDGKYHVDAKKLNPKSAQKERENNSNTLEMMHSGQVAKDPQVDEQTMTDITLVTIMSNLIT